LRQQIDLVAENCILGSVVAISCEQRMMVWRIWRFFQAENSAFVAPLAVR
jgi:hypothetical protein